MHGITAPGTAIIHQQAIRQPIAPKRREQGLLHGRRLLIRQHPEPDVKTGMIIQNRQRVRRPRHGGHCALEVHLPQLIGDRVFKPAAGRRAPHLVGPERRKKAVIVLHAGTGVSPCSTTRCRNLRAPQQGCAWRSARSASRTTAGIVGRSRRGRRDRSANPARPSSRYRASHL